MAAQAPAAQPGDGWSGEAIKRDKLGYGGSTEGSPSVIRKYICTKPVLILACVLLAVVIFVLGRPVLWAMVPELKQTRVDDSGAVQTVQEDEKEVVAPDIIAGRGPDQEEVIGKQDEQIDELKKALAEGAGAGSAGEDGDAGDSASPLVSEAKQVLETAASAKDAAMAIAGNENVGDAATAASEAAEAADEVAAAAKSVMAAAKSVEDAAAAGSAQEKGEAVQALEASASSATEALAHADKVAEGAKALAREARRARDRASASAARDTATVATAAAKEAKALIKSASEAAEKFRLENAGSMRKAARRLLSDRPPRLG